MHHRPVGPPLSARLRGTGTRLLLLTRRALRRRGGRLALGALVSAVVTTIVLSVPVVSGSTAGTRAVSIDPSSSSTASSSAESTGGGSPVVMGRDGEPVTTRPGADSPAVTAGSATVDSSSSGSSSGGATVGSASPARDAGTSRPTQPWESTSTGTAPSSTAGSPTAPATVVPPATAPVATTATATTTAPLLVPGTPAAAAVNPEERLLRPVNEARADAGCAALVPDRSLALAAQAHSAEMRDAGLLGPLTSAGGSVLDRGARAATLARGPGDPTVVLKGWLADATDRATVLDCSLTTVGIGLAHGPGGVWWTQLLE